MLLRQIQFDYFRVYARLKACICKKQKTEEEEFQVIPGEQKRNAWRLKGYCSLNV